MPAPVAPLLKLFQTLQGGGQQAALTQPVTDSGLPIDPTIVPTVPQQPSTGVLRSDQAVPPPVSPTFGTDFASVLMGNQASVPQAQQQLDTVNPAAATQGLPLATEPVAPGATTNAGSLQLLDQEVNQIAASQGVGADPEAKQGFFSNAFDKVTSDPDLMMAGLIVLAGALRRPELGQNSNTLFADGLQQAVSFYAGRRQARSELESREKLASKDDALRAAKIKNLEADTQATVAGKKGQKAMNPQELELMLAQIEAMDPADRTKSEQQLLDREKRRILAKGATATATNFPEDTGKTVQALEQSLFQPPDDEELQNLSQVLQQQGFVSDVADQAGNTQRLHNSGDPGLNQLLDEMYADALQDGDFSEYKEALQQIVGKLNQEK